MHGDEDHPRRRLGRNQHAAGRSTRAAMPPAPRRRWPRCSAAHRSRASQHRPPDRARPAANGVSSCRHASARAAARSSAQTGTPRPALPPPVHTPAGRNARGRRESFRQTGTACRGASASGTGYCRPTSSMPGIGDPAEHGGGHTGHLAIDLLGMRVAPAGAVGSPQPPFDSLRQVANDLPSPPGPARAVRSPCARAAPGGRCW